MAKGSRASALLRAYLSWTLVLIPVLVVFNALIYPVNLRAGIILSIFFLLLAAGLILFYFYSSRSILRAMAGFTTELSENFKSFHLELDIAYCLLDGKGVIIWKNRRFTEYFEKNTAVNSLFKLFPHLLTDNLGELVERERFETVGGRSFRLSLHQSSLEGAAVYALYFYDETEFASLREKNRDLKPVVGLIYIDNYDEAMESVEEVRRSLLEALIDRKITQYIHMAEGIVKKLEKDKYFFIIKHISLMQLEEGRFDILEEVKSVNIGNEMSVTLSIGIGIDNYNYSQNYEYARMAIDMALARGGDQAVLKDREAIRYFGGKSKSVEKNTRVKARVKAHALREIINTKDRIIIMGHKNMDIDVFGAGIGLWRIGQALGKQASIVCGGINASLKPIVEKFTAGDYPEDFLLNKEEAAQRMDDNTLLVVVDVNRPSITEAPELLKLARTIVVLDHHRQSSEIIDHAVLSYIEPYASSACEMVAEILQYIAEDIRLRSVEADAMYAGIVIDTHNFTTQTGVRTFEAAAFLRRHGADVTRVRKLFRDRFENYVAKAQAIHNAEIYRDCFAISECCGEGIESPMVVGAQAANELLDIVGIRASVVLTPCPDVIYVSARSIDEVNVQIMMEKLGGGGHRNIAGVQLREMSLETAREKIKAAIDEMIEKGEA